MIINYYYGLLFFEVFEMNQAKQKATNEVPFQVKKNAKDKRALEQRYSFAYKSAVSSTIRQANTSPLENFISSIEKEELAQDGVLDTVLAFAGNILHQLGYTNSLIESRSQKKLKKTYTSLQKQLEHTDDQIGAIQLSLDQIDNYIIKESGNLQEYQNKLSDKKVELKKLREQIIDYEEETKNSLNPQEEFVIRQARLDFDLQEQLIEDLKETCETTHFAIEEYYAQKSQDYSLLSLFEGNKIMISALTDRVSLALERENHAHPLSILSSNRISITNTYKVQDDLLKRDNRLTHLYNQKTTSLPTYKTMSQELTKKRQSRAKINR